MASSNEIGRVDLTTQSENQNSVAGTYTLQEITNANVNAIMQAAMVLSRKVWVAEAEKEKAEAREAATNEKLKALQAEINEQKCPKCDRKFANKKNRDKHVQKCKKNRLEGVCNRSRAIEQGSSRKSTGQPANVPESGVRNRSRVNGQNGTRKSVDKAAKSRRNFLGNVELDPVARMSKAFFKPRLAAVVNRTVTVYGEKNGGEHRDLNYLFEILF